MPNWCSNTIEIEGTKEQINAFVSFLDEPTPPELKEDGWYEWNVENWGTKWNCDAQDWVKVENPNEDQASVTFGFNSAWAPPTALYEFIESNSEFILTASYLEEGMSFVGQFAGGLDECYEFSDVDSLEEIPEELVDEWNLVELIEQREEWDNE